MAEDQILTTLTTKQAEIERYIADTTKRLDQARADLAHVNATLRLFETQRDEAREFPAYIKLSKLFRRGELPKLCTEALRAAPEGELDTRQIAAHVMASKGWDTADRALAVSMTHKVVHMLDEASRRRARFVKGEKRGGVTVWRLL